MPCTCTPETPQPSGMAPMPGQPPVRPQPPGMFGLAPAPQPMTPRKAVADSLFQRELNARGPMFYPALPGYGPPRRSTNFIGG